MLLTKQQMERGQKRGTYVSGKNANRAIGRRELERLESRYRERRIRDVEEAKRLGMPDEFLNTVGAQYIAGESN